jgi:hypothetical protein
MFSNGDFFVRLRYKGVSSESRLEGLDAPPGPRLPIRGCVLGIRTEPKNRRSQPHERVRGWVRFSPVLGTISPMAEVLACACGSHITCGWAASHQQGNSSVVNSRVNSESRGFLVNQRGEQALFNSAIWRISRPQRLHGAARDPGRPPGSPAVAAPATAHPQHRVA